MEEYEFFDLDGISTSSNSDEFDKPSSRQHKYVEISL
jgi:hypothetical protein